MTQVFRTPKLPHSIIQRILAYTIHRVETAGGVDVRSTYRGLTRLALVCKKWKMEAFAVRGRGWVNPKDGQKAVTLAVEIYKGTKGRRANSFEGWVTEWSPELAWRHADSLKVKENLDEATMRNSPQILLSQRLASNLTADTFVEDILLAIRESRNWTSFLLILTKLNLESLSS
jgi:hypothetical protein